MPPARRLDNAWPLALVLALVCGPIDRATAALEVGPASTIHEDHHGCACGMNCRGPCCCSKRPEPKPPAVPPRIDSPEPEGPKALERGPCLASAPCGDPAAPTASPSLARERPSGTAAPRLDPPEPGRFVVPRAPSAAATIPSDPPEEPPELLGAA